MSFIRVMVMGAIPVVFGLIVFLEVADLTEKLLPFNPEDPFLWSWIKGIGPAGLASYLAYAGTKRILAKLGVK